MSDTKAGGRFDRIALAVIASVVAAAYANTISAEFVYDDLGSIVGNPAVHWRELSLDNLHAAWRESVTRRVVAKTRSPRRFRFAQTAL